MANDRMFLRCPCGAEIMLAKNMGGPWSTAPVGATLEEKLDAWFEEHALHQSDAPAEPDQFAYPALPRLVYESDPDYVPPKEERQ